ncbi:MAG: galactitol-1-phosphate 5-dehydrogenase [Ruminococcus flavefaciens]|nr:galactitol-1-phosphate 5-dehydrogenase [Ruminococcus flavefaciens]
MKAWVLHGINDFRMESVEEPVLKDEEVLVAVKAAGICGSDIPRVYQTGTYTYPTIPGHEFSGVVVKTGAKVDARFMDKRVGVFPLIPCESCAPCIVKKYEMCRHYSYLGSRRDGGFAEYAAVPWWNLLELPEQVSFEQAAMMEPMAVAVHAMRSAIALNSNTVAVCGLGTIGLLLTMFLLEAGVSNLLVIGNKEFQKEMVLKLGVPEECFCDSRRMDIAEWVAGRTDGYGADVFFECVGRNVTAEAALNAAAPGGIVQLIGNPASDMTFEKTAYWKILRNQLTVKGCWNSSFTHEETDDWHYVLERLQSGKIKPEQYITQKFAFEDLDRGFQIMRDKTEEYVKVMMLSE